MIESARFSSSDGDAVIVVVSGVEWSTPIDSDNEIASDLRNWIAAGNLPASYTPPPPTLDSYTAAVQTTIDETARSKNYADGVSLASYSASTNAQWAAEAAAFIAWRDQVWASMYQTMAAVEGGQQAQPTIAQLISALPTMTWPT